MNELPIKKVIIQRGKPRWIYACFKTSELLTYRSLICRKFIKYNNGRQLIVTQ